MIEELYKHTLESLLKNNSDDIEYFHNELCSDDTKVHLTLEFCILKTQKYVYTHTRIESLYIQFYHSFMFLQLGFYTKQFREAIQTVSLPFISSESKIKPCVPSSFQYDLHRGYSSS